MNILVLHGPNLNLLGERPGDDREKTLAVLDTQLRARAEALGATLRIVQSNHEGALIDAIHEQRRWADAILINPEVLTHTSYALREALWAVGKPAIEVHLTDIRRRESWRRKSVIKDVCKAQVMGKGFASYLEGLERLVKGAAPAKKARAATPKATPAAKTKAAKSLGRKVAAAAAAPVSSPASDFLTRALVRQKIADRLAGKLTPGGLSTWARSRWLDVQRGAAAESGQRELLEETLQALVLSAMPSSKLGDEELIDLMTQLEK